jgi:hypothetical protein
MEGVLGSRIVSSTLADAGIDLNAPLFSFFLIWQYVPDIIEFSTIFPAR